METPQQDSAPSKKTMIISPKRIGKGILIGIFLVCIVLFIDDSLTGATYYRDLSPHWTPDGRGIVFVRWYSYKYNYPNPFELCHLDLETGKTKILYRSHDGYTSFGIRQFRFSSDGKFLDLRINKTMTDRNAVEDLLVKVPLSGGTAEEWLLEKKNPYDIFLSFKDDRVLLRRMISPETFHNEISEYRFSDQSLVNTYEVPANTIVSLADFCEVDKHLFSIMLSYTPQKGIYSWIYDLETGVSVKAKGLIPRYSYLPGRNSLLWLEQIDHMYTLWETDMGTAVTREVTMPFKYMDGCEVVQTGDESLAYLTDTYSLASVNLKTGKVNLLSLPVPRMEYIDINKDNTKLIYCSSDVVMVTDLKTRETRQLTQPSLRSKLLQYPLYTKYINARNKLLFGNSHGYVETRHQHR